MTASSSLSRPRERAGVRAVEPPTVRARALRCTQTKSERLLWQHLRDRRMQRFKFRRQHPIGPYFADLACLEARLVVELDGDQHADPEALIADTRRTAVLQRAGFTVLRFGNRQVLQDTEAVLTAIWQWLAANCPHPGPLPQAGEGEDGPHPNLLPQAGEGAFNVENP